MRTGIIHPCSACRGYFPQRVAIEERCERDVSRGSRYPIKLPTNRRKDHPGGWRASGTEGVESAISSHVRCHLGSGAAAGEKGGRIRDHGWGRLGNGLKASWRNRRASIHLSPLASVPSALLLAGSISSIPPVAQHVNPPVPPLKIPRSAWHTVVQRAAQGESLRSIARSLDTSYEAVRRVLLAARQELLGEQQGPPPGDDEDVG